MKKSFLVLVAALVIPTGAFAQLYKLSPGGGAVIPATPGVDYFSPGSRVPMSMVGSSGLKPLAGSADWGDILNKPTAFETTWALVSGKPTFFDGAYSSLTGRPTIPAAQVQSDWNAASGMGQILNKPTIPAAYVFAFAAPVASIAITSGTAFQPRSAGPCLIAISSILTGAVGVNGTITIAESSTSGGTYTTVTTDSLGIFLLAIGSNKTSGLIPVPAGYWVKVTYSGGITGTFTRWDI